MGRRADTARGGMRRGGGAYRAGNVAMCDQLLSDVTRGLSYKKVRFKSSKVFYIVL